MNLHKVSLSAAFIIMKHLLGAVTSVHYDSFKEIYKLDAQINSYDD
jgi:hypothetical protein